MATYYKPSNKFSFSGFPHFLASLLFLIPITGVAYAYLLWYIPLIYINLLVCIGFGALAGFIMNQVIQRGKIRNTIVAAVFGFLAGAVALYCQWVVWLDLVLNAGETLGNDHIGISISNISIAQTWALFQSPATVWSLLKQVNDVGTWGIRGATVSGAFLAVIWVIEAGIILVFATVVPMLRAAKPFCETGNDWADETELPAVNFIEDGVGFKSDLENDKSILLSGIQPAENLEGNHAVLTVYQCPASDLYYLSAKNRVASRDKNGKLEFKDTNLVEYISIKTEEGKALLAMQNSPISV